MNFKKIFLPVGLILAIIAAMIIHQPGAWLKNIGAVPFFVVVIFLLNGWHLNMKEAKFDKKFIFIFSAVAIGSLGIGPFIGYSVAKVFNLAPEFTTGLIVMSTVPVTLSSAIVITGVSGGNAVLALFMTIGLNLAGIFTVPFMLKLCLSSAEDIEISASKLLFKLMLLVFLPFIIGYGLKKITKLATNTVLKYTPSTCVILTVYVACSISRKLLMDIPFLSLPVLVFAVLTVHLLLMGIMWLSAKVVNANSSEQQAMLFVGSQKTLPLAISVLSMLPVEAGIPVILCLIFHFSQLLLDSFIASRLAGKAEIELSGSSIELAT